MTYAYSEHYLDDAMQNLGEALDYAVNVCGMSADNFMTMFISSGYAEQFASGVAKVVSGLSGSELVLSVLEASGKNIIAPRTQIEYDCSVEYWCGYILAYYQWYSSLSFKEILKYISMSELSHMYATLHEASEDKALDTFDSIIQRKAKTTKLATLRKTSGLSQKELAERSGVSLRLIQQYEQRARDINKAAIESVGALAKVLGCKIDDLIEPYNIN